MSWQPLRFLHAAGLRLDHPPAGTGPLPDDLRRLAEDATLISFDRLIDVAIERQVDFVLLAGDTFDDGDGSLRAQVALVEGCSRLDEQHIRVFVLPGRADPPLAWRTPGDLPDNVTALLARDDEPAACIRAGQLVATVARAEPARQGSQPGEELHGSRGNASRRHPFAIGLVDSDCLQGRAGDADPRWTDLPFDYLALGGPGRRQTLRTPHGLAHHPGPLQALARQHTGPHGFTVVEVDAAGAVHHNFVAAAPLRWERFDLQIDAGTTRDALVNAMRRELSACRAEPGEQLWFVEWHIAGAGGLARSLEHASVREELWSALVSEPTRIIVPVRHSLRLLPGRQASADSAEAVDSPLNFRRFDAELPHSTGDDLRAALRLPAADLEWQSRLRSILPHLDAQTVDDEAARLGATLFSAI